MIGGGLLTRVRESFDGVASSAGESGSELSKRGSKTLTSSGAKKLYAALGVVVAAVGLFYYTVQSRGMLAAVLYTFLFGVCATLFPVAINLFGGATPNSVGKLHLLLGAVAFDHHYLVQRDHAWEWCPGDRGRVWIDDEWHEVEGEENYSVLGWRPFGILRYKDPETWADKRVDAAGVKARGAHTRERDPTTDGGVSTVERGSFREVAQPHITGQEGTWLLDLKRIFTTGVRKIGDIELVETAEEVIERKQVTEGKMGSAGPLVETIGGLFLGILAGYGYLFLMG